MIEFKVEGMTCNSCANIITRAVKSVDSSADVSVDLRGNKVTVKSKEEARNIAVAIEEAGYAIINEKRE